MTTHLLPCSSSLRDTLQDESQKLFPEFHSTRQYWMLPDPGRSSSRLRHTILRLLIGLRRRVALKLGFRTLRLIPDRQWTAVRLLASIIVAVSGGALLIVPMVIMSFNTNRTKSLLTVSLAVLFFGFFLGAVVRSKSSEVFIATATYAAVLVVFVGSNGSGSG